MITYINKKHYVYFVIIFSLIFSIFLSFYYINQYDGYNIDGVTHIMLKEETFYHWHSGAKIIEQIKNGEFFFTSGEWMFTKPLPQRLVALYSYFTNFSIMENWEAYKIALGGKFPFLIIQSIAYYFSLFFFYKKISKIFNEYISIFIIFFLCVEPTLLQYHSSFWTESFYFTIQILLLTFMLDNSEKKIKFLIIGFLLGLLFIQRSAGIFYVIIVFFYYLFTIKNNKLKKIIFLILPYFLICLLIGIHNYKRSNIFYVMPTEGKYGMYKYFAKNILIEAKNLNIDEVNKIEMIKSIEWIRNNMKNINYKDFENINSPFEIGLKMINEKDKIKFYEYLNKRSYEILLNDPFITFKNVINGFIHFTVLNPFFVYFDYEFYKDYSSSKIGDFVFSQKHKELIPIRISYSLIVYLICFVGFIKLTKNNLRLSLLLIASIFYYYLILGWYGKTRLFTPCLIYLSVFFGIGSNEILKKLIKSLKIKFISN